MINTIRHDLYKVDVLTLFFLFVYIYIFFSAHLTKLFRSLCKRCLSPSLLTFICVICKFQYIPCYIIVQVIGIY